MGTTVLLTVYPQDILQETSVFLKIVSHLIVYTKRSVIFIKNYSLLEKNFIKS